MMLRDLVIRSQLVPPRQRRGGLSRPRLESRLLASLDYPLTLVHAGTGYGKSTALAALAANVAPLAWYTVTETDRDPLLFLAHLLCACEPLAPGGCEPAWRALEEGGLRVTPAALTPLLNALTAGLERDALLVVDDYHLVAGVAEIAGLVERLVDYLPPRLHLVLSGRRPPPLAGLTRLRARGQVLSVGRADLAFTVDEAEALFRDQYHTPLTRGQAEALVAETEGWAIALQMVWQRLQSEPATGLDAMLGRLPSSLEILFDYLAQDVLARQPPALQRFLLATSVLREMQAAACDHLLEGSGSAETLHRLVEDGLFVVALGDRAYRYQRLFHDFLRSRLRDRPEQRQALHRRAAGYFRAARQVEESVYHFIEAQDHEPAAALLEETGPGLVAAGRLDALSYWIGRLPPETRAGHPALDLLLGDVLRLRAQFEDALARYLAAEAAYAASPGRSGPGRSGSERIGPDRIGPDRLGMSMALRGQAQVYLDTVRPLKAESLLQDALRLLEPMEHRAESAALLDLLAENRLNLGSPDAAEALHHEARLLRTEADPGGIYLEARAMLRTGRLAEAQRLLEQRAAEEARADQARPQRFHRETLLLLSLICSLQGDVPEAERTAHEGIAVGRRLHSPFVEAVGMMRLGHALQLKKAPPWQPAPEVRSGAPPWTAREYYESAIRQVRAFNSVRTTMEPLWGLCRVHGYGGDLAAARRCADEALEIGRRAGDEWMCDLVQVIMGAGYALHREAGAARDWLGRARDGFGRVGDRFGQAAAWLWLALDAWWSGEADRALVGMQQLLGLARAGGWDALLVRRTFLGLRDDQALLPLLIEARRQGVEAAYAGRLLEGLGLGEAECHPGHTLWVRTLGPFAAWREGVPVAEQEWQREKARRVFQLLLTQRGQWFHREQIVDRLWPNLTPEAADRDFRVALNALSRALEPDRPRSAAAFFVARRGSMYGLNPAAQIRVDADEFARLAAAGDDESLRQALALYRGDYLPECLYEDWSEAERQRLRALYLTTAERLARSLLDRAAWDEALAVCEALLARDDCWEEAYRLMMRAHAGAGRRGQVQAAYQRCVAALRDGLDVAPSAETQALARELA